jgi:glycosyltransferase involved in cell wall biosynthesis
MRICVVTTLHEPKDDRIYYKEVLSLRKRYRDITLVAPRSSPTDEPLAPGVRFVPLSRRRGLTWRLLRLPEALVKICRLRPDVCHLHDFDLVALIPFLRVLTGAKLVYDVHEIFPEHVRSSFSNRPWLGSFLARCVEWLEYKLAGKCHVVLTVVDYQTHRFQEAGVRAIAIYNYPRPELLKRGRAPRYGPKSLDGRPVLLFHGAMNRGRGLFDMLAAIGLVRQSIPEVLLLLIGFLSEQDRDEANRVTGELHVEGNVQIVQHVDHGQIADWLSQATIGLVPTRPIVAYHHALPIKLFEFMIAEVPVLAANLPGIAPYVRTSGAGLLFESGNPVSLAEGICRMLTDEAGLRRMGENGRRAVEEKWNWGKMEERLFEVYGELDALTGRHAARMTRARRRHQVGRSRGTRGEKRENEGAQGELPIPATEPPEEPGTGR